MTTTGWFRPTSNRTKWSWTAIDMVRASTGDAVDLTGATLKIAIGDASRPGSSPLLSGSNSDGIVTILSTDSFSVVFPASQMATLAPGEYSVGMVVTLASGEDDQLIDASLPVTDGVISA